MTKFIFTYIWKNFIMKPTDEYILKHSENYQAMMLFVLTIIDKELLTYDFGIKWGIPFVSYNKKPFCYLLVNTKKGFLDVGFYNGFQLKRNLEFLVKEKRKTIQSLRYSRLEEINHLVLEDVIREAKTIKK